MDILRVKEFKGNIFIDPCENCIFKQVFIDMSIHEKVRFKASSPDNYDHQKGNSVTNNINFNEESALYSWLSLPWL